jgi:tetratricopeptide (TPR) repeat protein
MYAHFVGFHRFLCGALIGGAVCLCFAVAADSAEEPKTPMPAEERQARLKERDRLSDEVKKLKAEGKLDEAQAAAEKMLAIEREVFGDGDDVAGTLVLLAGLQEQREQFGAARKYREQILQMQIRLHGAENWRIGDARRGLELTDKLEAMGRDQRKLFERANRLIDRVGELARAGELREAVRLAEESLELRTRVLGADHWITGNSWSWLGQLYDALDDFDRAENANRQALANRKQAYGEQHPNYATALDNMATTVSQRGDLAETVRLRTQALEIRKSTLGIKHPNYAVSLHNLAFTYREQGDYSRAEALFRDALAVKKEIVGEQHSSYADTLDGLGGVYWEMQDYGRAEGMFRRALEIKKAILGEEHIAYSLSLNNLGLVYQNVGDYARAETCLRQSLANVRDVLGEQHPRYAVALDNLAELYRLDGENEQAEALFRQEADVLKKVVGEKDRRYAHCLNQLGVLYGDTGDYEKAEACYLEALEIYKQIASDKDFNYLRTLQNVAQLYANQRKYERAVPLIRQVVETRKEVSGAEDSNYLGSLEDMIRFLGGLARQAEERGDFDAARAARQEALDLRLQSLGAEHWKTTDARLELAHTAAQEKLPSEQCARLREADQLMNDVDRLDEEKKHPEAIAAAKRAVEIRREILGENDVLTANSLDWLGYVLNQAGKYDEARPVLEQALAACKQALGERHPQYALGLNKLALAYSETNAPDQAVAAYRQVLAIRREALGPDHGDYIATLNVLATLLDKLAREQLKGDNFAAARQGRQEMLNLRISSVGENHWRTINARLLLTYVDELERLAPEERRRLEEADELDRKVLELYDQSRYRDALALAEKSEETRRSLLGEGHVLYYENLEWLGLMHEKVGDYARSESLRRRGLELAKVQYGERHPRYADALHSLAGLHQQTGQHALAEQLYRQTLVLRKETLGTEDADYAESLNDLAINCGSRGERAEEEFLLRQAVALHRRVDGPQAPAYAVSLGNLGVSYHSRGAVARAEPLLREAAEIFRQAGGEANANYAWMLRALGDLYKGKGSYSQAEKFYRQALEIYEATLGKKHPDYAGVLSNLGVNYLNQGQPDQARPLLEEAVRIIEADFGKQSPEYAEQFQTLGWLHRQLGQHSEAEKVYRQILEIRKNTLGENHPLYAYTLRDLAWLYRETKDLARAQPLYQQALTITARASGESHPDYARLLDEASAIHQLMGDNNGALSLRLRAVQIFKQTYGESHPVYATALSNLAWLYHDLNDLDRAEQLYRQSLAIEKEAGDESKDGYTTGLVNLGSLLSHRGDYTAADPLLREAAAIRKTLNGERHPKYAQTMYHLAWLEYRQGHFAEAEWLLRQSQTIFAAALGEQHAECAKCLQDLADVYAAQGDFEKAREAAHAGLEIDRRHLEQSAAAQSEREQLAASQDMRNRLDLYLSAALRSGGQVGAYQHVLGWKGAVSARQNEMRRLRRQLQAAGNAPAIKFYDDLVHATAKLAALSRSNPDPDDAARLVRELEAASNEVDRLERALADASTAFRRQQGFAQRTTGDIRAALPAGAVLIDLLDYWDFDPQRQSDRKDNWQNSHSQRRLIAFVVRPDQTQVAVIELGPTESVAAAVNAWRKTFGRSATAGAELRRLLWEPLAPHLPSEMNLVVVSPDGVTTQFPWGALPGSQPGTYLIEEIALAVAPVPARLPDLLAEEGRGDEQPSLLLVGDVRFDGLPGLPGGDVARAAPHATRSGELFHWSSLPGAKVEAQSVKQAFRERFSGATVAELSQADATEGAVRREAPRSLYLHFATHGYFAPPELRSALAAVSRTRDVEEIALFQNKDVSGFHPGLLSGLVLAGANRPVDYDHDDGILTALEVEALDLSGAELATLSACETGLGESSAGEGLLGLQRAFHTAGARTWLRDCGPCPTRPPRC